MPGAAATIAVVIPTLNEAARIAEILTHTRHLGFDDYVVVDGGSTDDTVAVAGDGRRADIHLDRPPWL